MIIFFWEHLHDQYHQHLDHLQQQHRHFRHLQIIYITQLLTREKEEIKYAVQKELGNKIYELPDDPPELELGDGLVNILEPEAKDIWMKDS